MRFTYLYMLLVIASIGIVSCGDDEPVIQEGEGPTIWDGPILTFTLANGADFRDTTSQDMITPSVIISRSVQGGQIFNVAIEDMANSMISPAGTEWAVGRVANLDSLTFAPFRTTVGSPQQVVGQELVLHLVEDDVYLDIAFTSWSSGNNGFQYTRATE